MEDFFIQKHLVKLPLVENKDRKTRNPNCDIQQDHRMPLNPAQFNLFDRKGQINHYFLYFLRTWLRPLQCKCVDTYILVEGAIELK